MALSVFADRAAAPGPDDVARVLGPALAWWDAVRDAARSRCAACGEEWGYTGRTTGWGLRVKDGRRVVVYLTPREGAFLVSVVLGERAAAGAGRPGLPPRVPELVSGARRHAEGRGVRTEVRSADDVPVAVALVELKLQG
jgi:hypothetical protein